MSNSSELKNEPEDFEDDFFYDDEDEFIPCSRCDGHPACQDFGCAYEAGLGNMTDMPDWEKW